MASFKLYFTLDELIALRLAKCGPEKDLVFNAIAGHVETPRGFIWYPYYATEKRKNA